MSRRRGLRSRGAQESSEFDKSKNLSVCGSGLNTLSEKDKAEIHAGVQHILSEIGFEQLPKFLECFIDNKTIIKNTPGKIIIQNLKNTLLKRHWISSSNAIFLECLIPRIFSLELRIQRITKTCSKWAKMA